MNNTNLLNSFLEKLRLILQLLKRYYKTAEVEDLHKLRVQIKRLEALVKLPQFENMIHGNSKIKKLFHKSGKIREKQVMMQMFLNSGRFDLSPAFVLTMQTEINDSESNFFSKRNSNLKLVKEIFNQNFQINTHKTKQQFLDYFKTLALKAISEFTLENKKANLHEVRKTLKELMYNIEVLNRSEVIWLSKFIRIDLLDDLQEKLGNWHDNTLLIKSLKPFDNEIQIGLILKKIIAETKALRIEIKKIGSQLSIIKSNTSRRKTTHTQI